MAKKATPNKENLILTLEQTLGVVSIACKKAKIGRSTHYRWYKEDPEYKARVDEVRDLALDFVESRLFKRIAENSDTMIMYYLNNHGASRGYGHRSSGHRGHGTKSADPNSESEVVIRIIKEERTRDK